MESSRGINVIRVGDREFLLTVIAGDSVHLSPEAEAGQTARRAVPDRYLSPRRAQSGVLQRGYDLASLAQPRWGLATSCGREWIVMAGAERDDPSAPSCRKCLAILDKLFPEPELDNRFSVVVEVITETVVEHGYAEMWHVPGDQQAALRKRVRASVRKRTGYGTHTLVRDSLLAFICEPIHEMHAAEQSRVAARAMDVLLTGKAAPIVQPPWRLSWDTWAVG